MPDAAIRPPCWAATLLVLLGLWAVVLVLFRGSASFGMSADEVTRLDSFMTMVRSEARELEVVPDVFVLRVGPVSMRVMTKTYISSIAAAPFVPALLIDRQPEGLRALQLAYFLLAVSVLFLALRRYDFALGAWAALLLATAPHLYPEARYGFVWVFHVVFLAFGALCVRRGLERPAAALPWFLAGLATGLCVNVAFYSLWTLAGIGGALCIVFPRETWRAVGRPLRAAQLLAGLALGAVNYVVYNVAKAGASLRPLLLALFDREAYNQAPIDYSVLPPFNVVLRVKLVQLLAMVGEGSEVASVAIPLIALASVLGLGAIAFLARRQARMGLAHRLYLLAPVALMLTFLAILITPQSGRAGHWAYLSPLLELSVAGAVLAATRELPLSLRPWTRQLLAAGALAAVAALFFLTSNRATVRSNRTPGYGVFSPAIYDIHDALSALEPGSFHAFAADWGFWAPLYFLSLGEVPVSNLAFHLIGPDYERSRDILVTQIVRRHREGKDLYVLYHAVPALPQAAANFQRFVTESGAVLEVRTFRGPSPGDEHYVARITNVDHVLGFWQRSPEARRPRRPLVVTEFGPTSATAGEPFNVQPDGSSALWFRLDGDGQPRAAIVDGEIMIGSWDPSGRIFSLTLDRERLRRPGTRQIRVCDFVRDTCAAPVAFPVLAPG